MEQRTPFKSSTSAQLHLMQNKPQHRPLFLNPSPHNKFISFSSNRDGLLQLCTRAKLTYASFSFTAGNRALRTQRKIESKTSLAVRATVRVP